MQSSYSEENKERRLRRLTSKRSSSLDYWREGKLSRVQERDALQAERKVWLVEKIWLLNQMSRERDARASAEHARVRAECSRWRKQDPEREKGLRVLREEVGMKASTAVAVYRSVRDQTVQTEKPVGVHNALVEKEPRIVAQVSELMVSRDRLSTKCEEL